MLRWVVLLILLWLTFEVTMRLVGRALRQLNSHRPAPPPSDPAQPKASSQAAVGPRELIRCTVCGVHFPAHRRSKNRPPGQPHGVKEDVCSQCCQDTMGGAD